MNPTVTASNILSALFDANEQVHFRVFDDRKQGTFTGAKLECLCGQFSSIEDTLRRYNQQYRGVFYVVNAGGQQDNQITRINAQFVEMDNCSLQEQKEKIMKFPLPPSMIIRTRKSLHTYWFMDKNARVDRFRMIQKQLVRHFDGDPACVNESRVMRLPTFYHCKKEPILVECVLFHPERKYSQEQLTEYLPEITDTPIKRNSGTETGMEIVLCHCAFMQYCQKNVKTLPEPLWYAMISNLAPFIGGTEAIHKLSVSYPTYDETVTQKKINHFLASGTKPMTCQTIADKGFVCPLNTDTLVQMVHALPVTGVMLDDLQTAQDFVAKYLYNQNVVMAEAVISVELRQHFKFKVSFVKSLLQVYKDINRRYQKNKTVKRMQAGMDIPEWYEVTGKDNLRFMPGILAKEMATTQKVFYAAEQYFIYQTGVYQTMSEMEAQHMAQEMMLIRETKMSQIIDAEKQWRLLVQRDIRELNPNPYIINVRNGLYNVLEDTLTAHTPEYPSTVQLNVSFDRNADCPRFKQFLKEAMGGDMAQVRLIQEMLGYFLVPVNSAQKCFVIVGVGSAGKSVLLRLINEVLLGRENVSNVSWQALNERFKTAELFGKLTNIFADLPTKTIDDNGIFKALVGEDFLTVEKKNKDPFSFQSTARLLFSCNSIPRNYGDRSEGFYRRLIIIRFSHAVPIEKRDPDLLEKFRAEADGIFLYAIEGLRRLMSNHYRFSETQTNADELQQYREYSDSVLSFAKEYCIITGNDADCVGSTELFNTYKMYCEECGLKPYSQKTFVQQMMASFDIERGTDTTGKRRILKRVKLGEILG